MAKSILQKEKVCFVCKTPFNLELHHCFPGIRRKLSDEYGLTVWLCHEHHTGVTGVHSHKGHQLMEELKEYAQTVFEAEYDHITFMERFGKNYIGVNDDEAHD